MNHEKAANKLVFYIAKSINQMDCGNCPCENLSCYHYVDESTCERLIWEWAYQECGNIQDIEVDN